MKDLKTILFYIGGALGLVLFSVLFTGRLEVDIPPLPTPTPTATVTPVAYAGCSLTPSDSSFGYVPGAPFTTELGGAGFKGARLFVSGTVYAADCQTPLPDVLIEIWQNDADNRYPAKPRYLRAQLRTDADGKYYFDTVKPLPSLNRPGHINFRVTYPDGSHVLNTVIYLDEAIRHNAPQINPALSVSKLKITGESGTRYYSTFDIALAVDPAQMELADCLPASPQPGARFGAHDAPFTTTLASAEAGDHPLKMSGTVYAADRQTPLAGVLLEIWQADAEGRYTTRPANPLRARIYTDADGRFEFTTIRPGPVRVGCHRLPAHINYLVHYENFRPLYVTQFFADDPYLATNQQIRPAAVTALVELSGYAQPVWGGVFDIVLPERLAPRRSN